jgi:LacI family purine nucleotide synthesis repressor
VAAGLRARHVPVVLIGNDPAHPQLNSIDVDNFDGAYKATSHLARLGHRRIALVLGSLAMQESLDRRSGYLKAMQDAGLTPEPDLMAVGSYAAETGYETMQRWIAAGTCPSAVFCASDAIALGVLLALYKAGLRVPDQVAVVGFDDVPSSQYTAPPLTTVHQPIYDKGVQAANIIIDRIEGDVSEPVHVKLEAALVVRESCGAQRQVG